MASLMEFVSSAFSTDWSIRILIKLLIIPVLQLQFTTYRISILLICYIASLYYDIHHIITLPSIINNNDNDNNNRSHAKGITERSYVLYMIK